MQSATQATDAQETNLIPATQLREMTITKEELAKRQKNSVLENVMHSMVQAASQSAQTQYGARLNPQFDPTLLEEIVTELQTLGYTVTKESKEADGIGAFIQLNINW